MNQTNASPVGLYIFLTVLLVATALAFIWMLRRAQQQKKAEGRYENHRKMLFQIIDSGGINVTDNYGHTPLILAVRYNFMDVFERLMQHSPNLNASDNKGNTAMHFAAVFNNTEALKQLAQHGGSINTTNEQGFTPIMIAIEAGKLAAIRFFVDQKADLTLASDVGENAIELAQRLWFDTADSTKGLDNKEDVFSEMRDEFDRQTV